MPLVKVVLGEYVDSDIWFQDSNGNAIIGNAPATFTVRDFSGNLIVQDSATQDGLNSALWHCEFVIPSSAPVSLGGQRYQILWELPTDTGPAIAIERFEVYAAGDPIRPINNTDVIVLEGRQISDELHIDSSMQLGSLSYAIYSSDGDLVYDAGTLPADPSNSTLVDTYTRVYRFASPRPIEELTVSYPQGLGPFMGQWTYTVEGSSSPTYEFHPIYVVNMATLMLMNHLRKLIDRARMGDIHKYLSWTDMDLVHFLMRGLERINGEPPTQTSWSLLNIPQTLVDLLIKAAAVEALRALYLAEGMTIFNFSGQGSQLEVDRTGYIDNMINQLNSDLQTNLKSTKRMMTRASGPGILGISIGRSTNVMLRGSPWFFSRGWWSLPFPFPLSSGGAF